MSIPCRFRFAALLVIVWTAVYVPAQDLPSIPPTLDPNFWGQTNKPHELSLVQTGTNADSSQKHVSQMKMYRDSSGNQRTDSFYDNGRPMAVTLRDPNKNIVTIMMVVPKTVSVIPTVRHANPPPGKGWTVERLAAREIAGFPADGLRFSRTVPSTDGTPPVTLIEDDWVSNQLGVVLERTIDNPRVGKTTETVTELKQVEPDPFLFVVPTDYALQQTGAPAH